MKKAINKSVGRFEGFTILEIMIVIAIIGLVVSIALPNFLRTRTNARIQICIENLSQIESAKQMWGLENGKADGDVPAQTDLVGTTLYLKKMPDCPAGGTYSFQAIGVSATCNMTGHTL